MIIYSIVISFLVSLLACSVFVFFWRRNMQKEPETKTIIKKMSAEIGEMVTTLNGTTERNINLMENKIITLNELIEKAGKAAGVLKLEQEKQENTSRVYTSLARSKPLSLDVDESQSMDSSTETSIVDFEPLSTREKALVLHRKGESMDSIAAHLDMSRGEIELIISLHERRS